MSELGYIGDDDYGSVDLFGLDEFGQPMGLSQNWGAAIGTATQAGVCIAVKELTDMDEYAEGIGAIAGAAVGGAMIAMPASRAAGWTAVISSLVGGGIRQMHAMMSKKEKTKNNLKGLGLVEIENMPRVGYDQMDGAMGLPTVEPQVIVPGSEGLDGAMGMPPQLVGAGDYGLSQNPAAQQAQLVGPAMSGLGSHFGATLFG